MQKFLLTVASAILAAMMCLTASAQSRDVISGTITSANGEPLIGQSLFGTTDAPLAVLSLISMAHTPSPLQRARLSFSLALVMMTKKSPLPVPPAST